MARRKRQADESNLLMAMDEVLGEAVGDDVRNASDEVIALMIDGQMSALLLTNCFLSLVQTLTVLLD